LFNIARQNKKYNQESLYQDIVVNSIGKKILTSFIFISRSKRIVRNARF